MPHIRLMYVSLVAVFAIWNPASASAEATAAKTRTNFTAERPGQSDSIRSQARNGERGFFSVFNWGRRSGSAVLPKIAKKKEKPEPVLSRASLIGPMVLLRARGDDTAAPDETYARALYDRLNGEAQSELKVRAERAKPIIEFYKERNFRPLWVGEYGLNVRAERLLAQMATAELDGLRREEYQPRSLDGFDATSVNPEARPDELAAVELELTRAALRYARDISSGQVVPSMISRAIDVQPEVIKTTAVLAALATTIRPGHYLKKLAPQTDSYRRLKQALAKYRELERNGGWTLVPRISNLKPGGTNRAVVRLRQRLTEEGLYQPSPADNASPVGENADGGGDKAKPASGARFTYDKALVEAVKKFQDRHGLGVDGVVGGRTIAALNVSVTKRVNQLIVNLERRRWLPDDLGKTHVLVNLPAFQVRMFDEGKIIFKSRVIVGKRSHQTPEFSNRIRVVAFNPYWNVPRSIAIEEMLPQLLVNPDALSENFEVFGRRGRIGNSYDVDWEEAADNGFPISIRQKPGSGNALGNVKFLFPNRHNVYLHDTPTRSLFSRTVRMFSHGCVRVQKPREFAKIIMSREGWRASSVIKALNAGKNRHVKLEHEIPVHLTYRTAWFDENNVLHFQDDIYGRDQRMQVALGQLQLAMK